MEQRRLRLGDILDDYCPRERRVTNHVVVAMIEDEIKQTRCSTCDAEHPYKGGKAPRRKTGRAPWLAPFAATAVSPDPAEADPESEHDSRQHPLRATEPRAASLHRRRLAGAERRRVHPRRRAGPSTADPRDAAAARRDQDRAPLPEFTIRQNGTRGDGIRGGFAAKVGAAKAWADADGNGAFRAGPRGGGRGRARGPAGGFGRGPGGNASLSACASAAAARRQRAGARHARRVHRSRPRREDADDRDLRDQHH